MEASLNIEDHLDISAIEKHLHYLNDGNNTTLKIPAAISRYNIGARAFLCQLLNTWVRKTKDSPIIITQSGEDTEKSIDEFTDDAYGLCLSLMTIKQERQIFDQTRKNITQQIQKEALNKVSQTRPQIINRTKVFGLKRKFIMEFCFDHARYPENKFNRWFYQQGIEEYPLGEIEIGTFYKASIENLLAGKEELKKIALNQNIANEVTGIIKELFDNTHFHARSDFLDVPLIPNVRGIIIDSYSGKLSELKNKFVIGDPYFRYFTNPNLFVDLNTPISFLEISVLDSGLGFAQRKSGKSLADMSKIKEKKYVIECLTKYDRSPSKRGLKKIAAYLTKRDGFLTLRSGRHSIYRNFIEKPYLVGENLNTDLEEAALKDYPNWEGDDKIVSSLSEACGSLITILFPIQK